MKQYPFLIIALIGNLFLTNASFAQAPDSTWTLEKIWDLAAKQNRQLHLADLSVQESRTSIQEARDKLLPDLAVSGNYALNSKFLIYDNGLFSKPQDVPVSSYGYGFGYNLDFNIYNGGRDKRDRRAHV